FQDYANYLSEKKGGQLIKFSFRNKKYGHKLIGDYEIKRNNSIKKYRLYSSESSYFSLFLKGFIYNTVCYSCPYACNERNSDITLGDFWGIKEEMPEFFVENSLPEETSVSLVMINTDKGERFFRDISCHVISKSVDYEKVVKHNPQLSQPSFCDPKMHRDVFDNYKENGYGYLESVYKKYSDYRKYSLRISCYIPVKVKQGIKRLLSYTSGRN
ncbi:Coenzyme F420 hydrogenase/dehydrogenase, beta subunit C-terminal domain, partial [Mediterraneibacter glycyrrhizinilyticus]|uniref:Coenzyme F420 hydrogenase/dehydrogenase, beta subunit C-terminal domain n=1 Tax=Mediterraneibacter glycyrrhizinilyticus TaxID=342942 RepID=UPI00265831B2